MRLTRKGVLSRAKACELECVRKLNCWGSRLSDISICRELPNIEVVTLSVNQISSLQPLSHCQHLSELYLRKNNIQSLQELCHLQGLPSLRILWLAENPCCGADPHRYRMTVLRALPGLQKLDNQAVSEEELAQAKEEGQLLLPAAASAENGHSAAPAAAGDTDSADVLSFSMEETNKIRQQLGMKPLARKRFSSYSPKQANDSWKAEGGNILNAMLLLLQELDSDGLQAVHQTSGAMLHVLQQSELKGERQEEEGSA